MSTTAENSCVTPTLPSEAQMGVTDETLAEQKSPRSVAIYAEISMRELLEK